MELNNLGKYAESAFAALMFDQFVRTHGESGTLFFFWSDNVTNVNVQHL